MSSRPVESPLPTGTVTFLFTDIEGSTALWEAHPEAMKAAVARHDEVLRTAIESNSGHVFKTVGDAFCAAFATARDALAAALDAQRALATEDWGDVGSIRVRMALNTGSADERDGDYFGPALNRVARLLAVGHGGQVLLSRAAEEMVADALQNGIDVVDLGEHRLRDLSRPERIFQLSHPDLDSDFPALITLDAVWNNLPVQTTTFVGRETQIARVEEALATARLVTLTGVGGAGKSRLSLQVAADVLPNFPEGVWLIELAPITEPDAVARSIISTLGLRDEAAVDPIDQLSDYFRESKALLVLDNCEHLLDTCARLADSLLHGCPSLHILASSREGLGIGGEMILAVPSLSLPDDHELLGSDDLARFEAVRLFLDRAMFVRPDFELTEENAASVASICARLDGFPLAIELAAARVRMLEPAEIDSRLDSCFRILTGGSRTALPRQQTLRAAMDWSYDLLTDQEQALLRRLSVFSGGWDLEAAEAVGHGETIESWEVLDLLASLVDKSLIVVESEDERTRYRLLETVRQYARDRLAEAGETNDARDRHLAHFVNFAEDIEPRLQGPDQAVWLDRCATEDANVFAALDRASEVGAAGLGFRIGTALTPYRQIRSGADPRWLVFEDLLSHEASIPRTLLPDALIITGYVRYDRLDLADARTYFERSLSIAREIDDPGTSGRALRACQIIETASGNHELATKMSLEVLELARQTRDPLELKAGLTGAAFRANMNDDFETAKTLLKEALKVTRTMGDPQQIAHVLHNLGYLALREHDGAAARMYFEEDVRLCREIRNHYMLPEALRFLADAHRKLDEPETASEFLDEARAVAQSAGLLGHLSSIEFDHGVLCAELGDPENGLRHVEAGLEGLLSSPIHSRLSANVVTGLDHLAMICLQLERPHDAAILLGTAEATSTRMEGARAMHDAIEPNAIKTKLKAALGQEGLEAAMAIGRAKSVREAIEIAMMGDTGSTAL